MRKAAKQILVCAAVLLLVCAVCRAAFFRGISIYVPAAEDGTEDRQVSIRHRDVVRDGEAERRGGYLRIPVYAQQRGEAEVIYSDWEADAAEMHVLRVGRFNTVYDLNTGNFTGDSAVLAAVTLFWLLVSAIMMWHFFQAKGSRLYDYGTI